MAVKIETYRGYDISFEPASERFTFSLDTGNWSEKQSYAACKKAIDDFIKANASFEPFYVRHTTSGKKYKIIAIRKDARFVYEGPNGSKEQLSEYDERNYILFNESDDIHFATIASLEAEMQVLRNKISETYDKVKGKTLRDIKPDYTKHL